MQLSPVGREGREVKALSRRGGRRGEVLLQRTERDPAKPIQATRGKGGGGPQLVVEYS